MNSSTTTTAPLPPGFRAYGFLFFMTGAFFHCIDFMGVEDTLEWGAGLGFLGAMILTILFWTKYAINRRVWKYLT